MHLDLPSPTYRLDGTHFAHLQQLRRSLSRSPSKPSRFQLHKSDSPRSPISPLALARAFSPKAQRPTSPNKTYPESPLGQSVPPKKKFTLRRSTANFKASPRTRQNSKSPRRNVLGDSPTGGNTTTPFYTRIAYGQENDTPAGRPSSSESLESMDTDCRKFGLNDKPIKFEFAQRRPDLSPGAPVKSSPLKRNDGVMNLSGTPTGFSPVAKRRSLHSVANLSNDFESIFGEARNNAVQSPMENEESRNGFDFSTPTSESPVRRTTSLRKSTVMQRNANSPVPKPAYDGNFAMPGLAASKTRNRMSLDGAAPQSTTPTQTPFRKSTFDAGRMGLPTPFARSTSGGASQTPHPLSHAETAHTPASNTSSAGGFTPMAPPRAPHFAAPPSRPNQSHQFSRSLPIGVPRPHAPEGEHDSFDTPFKSVQQAPVPFSTGLISKKNRNADEGAANVYVMPDTPSKRQSYPPAQADKTDVIDTPLVKRGGSLFGDWNRPQPQFGTTSTPFSAHVSKFSTESFGKGTSVFGNMGGSLGRRGSIISVDGDDDLPDSQSPTANRTMVDSMADNDTSVDDMPPTPTKGHGASSRRSKESSLRRKTFRSRPSIGNDTFAAPETVNEFNCKSSSSTPTGASYTQSPSSLSDSADCFTPVQASLARTRFLRRSKPFGRPSPLRQQILRTLTPSSNAATSTDQPPASIISFGSSSPASPGLDSSFQPEQSRLSIGGNRRGSMNFNSSVSTFPPATPTTPRDHSVFFAENKGAIPIGLTKNDVDEAISSRFHEVKELDGGEGEFSKVYRVSQPVQGSATNSPTGSQVWVVKKSKKPYLGKGDRDRKMREVEILYALRGNDHVLNVNDHWEANSHLYIQTEYCEGGNLRRFLDTVGYSSRLDDFRIWKTLLELSQVSLFIPPFQSLY